MEFILLVGAIGILAVFLAMLLLLLVVNNIPDSPKVIVCPQACPTCGRCSR